jgi:glycosyltransferase involved in cell wall biosynthesis
VRNDSSLTYRPRLAVVIPACNEEPCIGAVLDELLPLIDRENFAVVVGVNASTDRTAQVARDHGVFVAETLRRGYGHGCAAAIDHLKSICPSVRGYVFFAGDGASEPRDIANLTAAFGQGYELVLGARTRWLANWRAMTLRHVVANFALGLWCGVLTGRCFTDLGPLRLIERRLFERMALREMTYGWTIEAQIAAAQLGASICEVPVHERFRIAGEQKVSGVNWRRTLSIGWKIVVAGWRVRWRGRATSEAFDAGNVAAVDLNHLETVPVPNE